MTKKFVLRDDNETVDTLPKAAEPVVVTAKDLDNAVEAKATPASEYDTYAYTLVRTEKGWACAEIPVNSKTHKTGEWHIEVDDSTKNGAFNLMKVKCYKRGLSTFG